MPLKNSPEAQEFLRLWDSVDYYGKLDLCRLAGSVSYDTARHTVSIWRHDEPVKSKPEIPVDVPWSEQIDIFKNMDRLVGLHNLVPSEVTIEVKTDLPIGVVYMADWQLGQPGVDYDRFKDDIGRIREEEGLFCEVGGDGYQNLIQPSKIGSSHNQIPIAPQRGLFVLTLQELKGNLKVLRTGNHNWWSRISFIFSSLSSIPAFPPVHHLLLLL